MSKEIFNNYGAVNVSSLLPKEFCQFFTHVLMRQSDLGQTKGDEQIPNAKAILDHEVMFETLQERLWPTIEMIVGEELIPTYAYARLYSNGDELKKHSDRPACEVSVTIQLGRSHHYSWPIYMGDQRFDMGEGDGVIYKGCDVEHWREICNGPKDYYSGQVFLHYVKKNGIYANEVGDSTIRNEFSYKKNRTIQMENK
jgi:hypothetical protein